LQFVWSDQNALRAGRIAISRLTELGIHMPSGSRLPAAIARIERAKARPIVNIIDDADFAYRLVQSHRTVLEFYVISTALHAIPGGWHDRLALAMGGEDIPDEDRSSMPRDAQFELLIISLVHHAGILDIEAAEPDIRVKAGDKWIGIAAKRVTSRAKLRKRLSHASNQIQRQYESGVEFGLIAINVDAAIDFVSHELGIARARAEFNSIAKASEEFIQSRPGKERVPGIQTFSTLFDWQPSGVGLALGLEFLTHSRWTLPESEASQIQRFLAGRGHHLERKLGHLLATL